MNFQEYINQKSPVKRPRVTVNDDDFYHSFPSPETKHQGFSKVAMLQFGKEFITYAIKDNTGALYTVDSDGNPKSSSVFVYEPKKN